MKLRWFVTVAFVLALGLSGATDALAQGSADPYERWNGTRDKFGFDLGFFFVNHSTFTRLQPTGLPTIPGVDLESDIGMTNSTTDVRVDGYLRLGSRHRVRVGWWEMNRQVVERIRGQIAWGDEVFPVDTEVGARWDTRVIKADYRFSAIKKQRLDFGVSLGFFIMRIDTGVGLTGEGEAAVTDTTQTAPLPMLGLDVEYEMAQKWILKGFVQYFGISIDDSIDGNWVEARAAVEYMPWQNVGFGLGYNYARVNIAILLTEGAYSEFEYRYRLAGPHLYAVLAF
jgi:hypothetical protein